MRSKFVIALLFICCGLSLAAEALTPEQVFWGWDDGRLTYEQVEELLELLEREDEANACALWYAYVGEPCVGYEALNSDDEIPVHARVVWRASLDSLGVPYAQSLRAETNYTRYRLKLLWKGDRAALRKRPAEGRLEYSDKKAGAVFGNLTYTDVQSPFSLTKFFGYAGHITFPVVDMSALLTLDSSYGLRLGTGNKKTVAASGMGIYHEKDCSGFAHVFIPGAEFALGWNEHWKTPLVLGKFNYSEKTVRKFQWNGIVYWHQNDSLRGPFQFPSSVATNEWWVTQRQSLAWSDWTFSWNERLFIPQDTGAASLEGAFAILRKRNAAALGANWRVGRKADDKFYSRYELQSGIHLFAAESLFVQMEWQKELFPRMTLGILQTPHRRIKIKNLLILNSRWSGASPLVFRHETQIKKSEHWGGSLRFDWKIERSLEINPNRFGFSLEGYL